MPTACIPVGNKSFLCSDVMTDRVLKLEVVDLGGYGGSYSCAFVQSLVSTGIQTCSLCVADVRHLSMEVFLNYCVKDYI